MKYFISSLGFWSKNVTSILNKNILLLKKKNLNVVLKTNFLFSRAWAYLVRVIPETRRAQ
jgi:hypothetical protein